VSRWDDFCRPGTLRWSRLARATIEGGISADKVGMAEVIRISLIELAGGPLKPWLVGLEWGSFALSHPRRPIVQMSGVQISGTQRPRREEALLASAPLEGEAVPTLNTSAETPPRET